MVKFVKKIAEFISQILIKKAKKKSTPRPQLATTAAPVSISP
jgi:hypothetical protein